MPDYPPEALAAAEAAVIEAHTKRGWAAPAPWWVTEISAAILGAAAPVLLREFAARVLLISEVAHGYRCPRCHGKPAATPRYGRPYRCGCGHTWTIKRMYDYERSSGGMLRATAEGKPLPDMPAKEMTREP